MTVAEVTSLVYNLSGLQVVDTLIHEGSGSSSSHQVSLTKYLVPLILLVPELPQRGFGRKIMRNL